MDLSTDGRLERLEKQVDRVDARIEAIEKALQEMQILMRQHGIERGRNYDAP